jgi:hypothetical protein
MQIRNSEGLSIEEIQRETDKGARLVHYTYAISLLVVTIRQKSDIYFVRAGENAIRKGLSFTVVTLLFGWWGIPFGPKHTIESLQTNLRGGKDVTDDVIATIQGQLLFEEAEKRKKAS